MNDLKWKHVYPSTGFVSFLDICFLSFLIFFLMACSSFLTERTASASLTANSPESTPALDIAPGNLIFRDDFTDQLNSVWTWQNEDVSQYKMNEVGWLEITGGNESILSGGQQTNLLWTSLEEGDFIITIHLKSQPLFDYQQAGLLLYADSGHFISLTRGHCMQCVLGGNGVFLETVMDGNRVRYEAATDATDLYLMIIRARGVVSGFYATEAVRWQLVADIRNAERFSRAALSVTNGSVWDEGYDVVGMFDFFEIRSSYHQKTDPPWGVIKIAATLK